MNGNGELTETATATDTERWKPGVRSRHGTDDDRQTLQDFFSGHSVYGAEVSRLKTETDECFSPFCAPSVYRPKSWPHI